MADRGNRVQELRTFAEGVGLSLDDFSLLDRALTHASAVADAAEPLSDYETLEFLGDAVLGLAAAHWLYENAPGHAPGEYTQMRAAVVKKESLARVADTLGIAPLIRLGKGEESGGGRRRRALLADCVEAIIAAVYLDQGWQTAQGFVVRVFGDALQVAASEKPVWDFKSRLQVYSQAENGAVPEFRIVRETGPDHAKEFDVEVRIQGESAGRGRGRTKRDAEQAAAREALIELGEIEG